MLENVIRRLFGIGTSRLYRPSKPARDERYLQFIRGFACCVCHWNRRIEAAHTGPHGLGQKSSDYSAIPLCDVCHRLGVKSLHSLGPVEFERVHELSIAGLVDMFQAVWEDRKIRRAA